MNRTVEVLRIEMEGRWYAEELGSAASAISELYDLRFVLELMREDQRDWEVFYDELMHFPPFRRQWKRKLMRQQLMPNPFLPPSSVQFDVSQLSRLHEYLEPDERLEVRRLSYASPGASDLAGIGVIVGHVKDFVFKLIDRHDTRRQRELNDERTAVEIERMRIENARSFVALGRELGFSESEMRKLAAHVDDKQEVLIRLVDQKKLTGVSLGGDGQSTGPDES
ncbi:MAG TPA: hypothetical protein VNO50_05295 [Pyrinomonadaceae bacterium]|nr:hypothetical protein [Pyrinomonadaceae bacterium]